MTLRRIPSRFFVQKVLASNPSASGYCWKRPSVLEYMLLVGIAGSVPTLQSYAMRIICVERGPCMHCLSEKKLMVWASILPLMEVVL